MRDIKEILKETLIKKGKLIIDDLEVHRQVLFTEEGVTISLVGEDVEFMKESWDDIPLSTIKYFASYTKLILNKTPSISKSDCLELFTFSRNTKQLFLLDARESLNGVPSITINGNPYNTDDIIESFYHDNFPVWSSRPK